MILRTLLEQRKETPSYAFEATIAGAMGCRRALRFSGHGPKLHVLKNQRLDRLQPRDAGSDIEAEIPAAAESKSMLTSAAGAAQDQPSKRRIEGVHSGHGPNTRISHYAANASMSRHA